MIPDVSSYDRLSVTRALVEATIGRQLRDAERVVDVFRITALLDRAKDQVDHAIRSEQARAARVAVRTGSPTRLNVTAPMLRPLERLFREGRREARAELERAGYDLARRRFQDDPARDTHIDRVVAALKAKLGGLAVRITNVHTVQLQLGDQGPVGDALATALINVLGARSVAADLVSTSMFAGMGATFEENQDVVGGWEYSAVLDGGTCDVCDALDGTEYESWDAIQDVLPDGGPNPDCYGGDRCRCRAVPAPA